NAAVETEDVTGTPNDNKGSAQDLEGSSLPQPSGGSRIAVIGTTQTGASDFYAFHLNASQPLTLAATGLSAGSVNVELQDSSGKTLALGETRGDSRVIADFIPSTSDLYYARVTGTGGTRYSLVGTRGSAFDLEPNSARNAAEDISLTNRVLGDIGQRSSGG